MPQLNPFFAARWKAYPLRIAGGLAIGVLLMVAAILSEQWLLLPLGAVIILWVAWFYATTSWQMRYMLDTHNIVEKTWAMLHLDSNARFACVEIGLRAVPLSLSWKLQRGTLKIIDIYNPQLMADAAIARMRFVAQEQVVHQPSDPRALWIESSVDSLPQRNSSVPAVVLDRVLFPLQESGDRRRLLREVFRILQPGGTLLVIEAVQRKQNWWLGGDWLSAETVEEILLANHFIRSDDAEINPLLHAFRVLKPIPEREQLTFNF